LGVGGGFKTQNITIDITIPGIANKKRSFLPPNKNNVLARIGAKASGRGMYKNRHFFY
jgi:hypothetical protein